MQTLTEQLLEEGFKDRVLTDAQLGRLISGSSQRRYNLVNRAMKAGELIRLRRGLYLLADKYRSQPCHPYALAQRLEPGSYVSLETALAFHGWIPEAVYTTAAVVPSRQSKELMVERLGRFTFHPLAIQRGYFLELVERVQLGEQVVLMAKPIRAVLDLVCMRKVGWQGLDWLVQGMRIEEELLNRVTGTELRTLSQVYKHKRVKCFIAELEIALGFNLGRELGGD
ncbi:MAG: type IV toxin-antitoxin system AbiEi family antitoxin domain-containing protein [Immundisolibacteraceae bacterium]|nr:type IV toxin-antitoxin system AbiEi family antitoxin domain-containing protein [Immundisolibacteraceae bacterium]